MLKLLYTVTILNYYMVEFSIKIFGDNNFQSGSGGGCQICDILLGGGVLQVVTLCDKGGRGGKKTRNLA